MSDNDQKPDDGGLDLDWDDALADLEKELDEGQLVAESAPMPQKAPPKPAGRPLYQPPTADELLRMKARDGRQTAPPPPSAPVVGSVGYDEDEDEDEGRTMVGALSEHLRSGLASRSDPPPRTTARPGPTGAEARDSSPGESPARNSAVDLDFDGLLDGLDDETSMYPAELPRVLRASQPGEASPPRDAPRAAPVSRPVSEAPSRPTPAPLAPTPAIGQARSVALGARPVPPPPGTSPRAGALPPRPAAPGIPRPAVSGVPRPGGLTAPAAKAPPPPLTAPKPGAPPLGRGASALAAAIAAKRAATQKATESSEVEVPIVAPPPALVGSPSPFVAAPVDAPVPPAADAVDSVGVDSVGVDAEHDAELDDVLAALDMDIGPAAQDVDIAPAVLTSPAESTAEEAFFREAQPIKPPPSIEEDLRDLDDAPAMTLDVDASSETALEASDGASSDASTSEDDDEVMIVAGDDDDDAEFTVSAGDDDGGDGDDEMDDYGEDEPPTTVAPSRSVPPPSAQSDRGAMAARFSVRSRKPRKELFPLVGRTPQHRLARAELLESLATKSKGPHAARLLVSAAELRRGTDTEGQIDGLLARALDAAPTDPSALRAARARATAASDGDRLVGLNTAEAQGTSRLALLAQLALFELGAADRPAMLASLTRLRASDVAGPSMLLPLLGVAPGASEERERALVRASSNTTDTALANALRLVAAASATHRDDAPAMHALGEALGADGILVRARARARATGEPGALRASLEAMGPALGETGVAVGEAARRLGALSEIEAGRAVEALEASRAASTPASLRVRARAAALAGDVEQEIDALGMLAQKTGSTERATSLARVAELRLARNELDLAEEALRSASLADPELAAPRVVRAQLSRLDPARAARTATAPEPGASLAAKAVFGAIESERSALGIAENEDDAPLAADVLGLDVAAELNLSAREAVDPLLLGLRRHAERLALDHRTGALLALSVEARAAGRDEEARLALEDARAASPDNELVLTEVARFAAPSDAAAAMLGASAACTEPRRASTLALHGAHLLEHASPDGPSPEGGTLEMLSAARRATDADPTNDVAWLTLSRAAKGAGDASTLAEAEQRLGELASTDRDAASHFIRAALARAGDDPPAAGALLARARERAPRDLVLFALSMRLGEGMADAERAAHLEASLSDAPEVLAPALALAAASTFESVGDDRGALRALGPPSVREAVGASSLRTRAQVGAGELDQARAELLDQSRTGAVPAQITALESLVALEERAGDLAGARTAQGAILELAAGHLPSLRWLERHAMVAGGEDELHAIEQQLSAALEDPGDAMAHLRTAVRLAASRPESTGDGADALLLRSASRVRTDLWFARRLVAAARASGDLERTTAYERELVALVTRPAEQASLALRAAETAASAGATAAERAAILAETEQAALEHPVLHAELAKLLDLLGDAQRSVVAWQRAGDASLVPATRAAAYHRAGVLAEDEIGDEERALGLYELAAEADVTHADVFTRAQRILERRGEVERLNALLAKRLSAGGDAEGLVDLHIAQAKLREGAGDRDASRAALRAALELAPEHPVALKRLAELSLASHDHRSAADALIRLARVRKDREELRWVFFALGDIYDLHIPDARRAEAAWKRVLKLAPDDLPSMERLAALYLREGPPASAIEQLEQLIKAEPDPDRARDHHLALSRVLEDSGDGRRAEQVLESARRISPTDLATLKAMADLYTRQRAQAALSMHLNRAVTDFRHALETDVADTAAWLGLVEVLAWRRREDAARVAASAGTAMGIVDVELAGRLDEGGGAPGLPRALGDESIEDAIAPPAVTGPLRAAFRAFGSLLERAVPFDPRTLRAEKLGPRDSVIRPMVQEIAHALGIDGEVEIWVAAAAPRAFLPVQSTPPVLIVGRDLLGIIDEREKRFLVGRALKIAKAQLALAVRMQPHELALLLAGLVLNADPNYEHGLDVTEVQEWARRVSRAVPRRALEDNGPLLFEMAGAPEHDPARLPLGVAELGSRASLLATGSVPQALSALAKMVVEAGLPPDPIARASVLAQVPEAQHLLRFAISDAHFEIRSRSGADRL
jgi:tetratricopeptide (TPR) repeat protein